MTAPAPFLYTNLQGLVEREGESELVLAAGKAGGGRAARGARGARGAEATVI